MRKRHHPLNHSKDWLRNTTANGLQDPINPPTNESLMRKSVRPTRTLLPCSLKGEVSAVLGYRDHYIVDGGKARIILSALVAPASIMDNTPLLDLVDWTCSRWQLEPKIAVGDAKYGTVPNIVGLEERGIKAYLPIPDLSNRSEYYSSDFFQYDAEQDQYICPKQHKLPLWSRRKSEEKFVYRAVTEVCNACPVKVECTRQQEWSAYFPVFLSRIH